MCEQRQNNKKKHIAIAYSALLYICMCISSSKHFVLQVQFSLCALSLCPVPVTRCMLHIVAIRLHDGISGITYYILYCEI